jgi:hypothetical protein
MNIILFSFYYVFFFKKNILQLSTSKLPSLNNNDNNNNSSKSDNKIYISKKYIYDILKTYNLDNDTNEYSDNYTNEYSDLIYDGFYKANNIINKKKDPVKDGTNTAQVEECFIKNNVLLYNINKNLYLLQQHNILVNSNVSNNIKLKIANEYLTSNITNYTINVLNGGLYNDWSFDIK